MQRRIKNIFNRKVKTDDFQLRDSMLKWDARNEYKRKHGKFDNLWQGPYIISTFNGRNAYFLDDSYENPVTSRLVNDRFLKHYYIA